MGFLACDPESDKASKQFLDACTAAQRIGTPFLLSRITFKEFTLLWFSKI